MFIYIEIVKTKYYQREKMKIKNILIIMIKICNEKRKQKTAPGIPRRKTHPRTNRARPCLTMVIRREPVFSTKYGCRQQIFDFKHL